MRLAILFERGASQHKFRARNNWDVNGGRILEKEKNDYDEDQMKSTKARPSLLFVCHVIEQICIIQYYNQTMFACTICDDADETGISFFCNYYSVRYI